jgi:hypothetical protein
VILGIGTINKNLIILNQEPFRSLLNIFLRGTFEDCIFKNTFFFILIIEHGERSSKTASRREKTWPR